jgi:hypothetical protein
MPRLLPGCVSPSPARLWVGHEKLLARDHAWTKDSARVTADALDALGRTEEAKALRQRYALASSEDPNPS